MPVRIENSVEIAAPPDLVWDITNDVANWPQLFTEYAAVEVLDSAADYLKFRLITHPDETGKAWSWVSERRTDRSSWVVDTDRVETGPFEFMKIRWSYEPTASGTTVRWTEEFSVRPSRPIDEDTMADRINHNTRIQLAYLKIAVEKIAGVGLIGQQLPGANGTVVDFEAYRGRPLVVILGNRDTQKAGHGIVESLRSHPQTVSVPIVQVAHLGDVPKVLHGMARRHIEAGYRSQLADLAARRAAIGTPAVDESTLLNIGLDWSGSVTGAFGFSDQDRKPVALVIDQHGMIAARCVGEGAFAAVRAALAGLAEDSAAR